MKLTLYFVIGLTIFMVVPRMVLSDDPVDESAEPITTQPTTDTQTADEDQSQSVDKSGTNDDQSGTKTDDQKQSNIDGTESDLKSDDSTEPQGEDESGSDEKADDLTTKTPSDTDPTKSPAETVRPDETTKSEPGTEPGSPNEPVTEPPKEDDKSGPKDHPKESFWRKLKFALSPKSPHFYIFIGVFGFIFVALLIFAYSRLFIHSQQREEYDISSRAERGPNNSRHETLHLDYFKTSRATVTA